MWHEDDNLTPAQRQFAIEGVPLRPELLTDEQLARLEAHGVVNGCGPRVLGLPIPEYTFHRMCNEHDAAYWIGNTARERKAYDGAFLRGMRRSFEVRDGSARQPRWRIVRAIRRAWLRGAALRYYLAVRAVGWTCYHYGRRRDWVDLQAALDPALCRGVRFRKGKRGRHADR